MPPVPQAHLLLRRQPTTIWSEIDRLTGCRTLPNSIALLSTTRRNAGASSTYISGRRYAIQDSEGRRLHRPSPDDRGGALGLGFGAGGRLAHQIRTRRVLRILEREWGAASWKTMQFVSLSLFGFSRGATEARAFVRRLIETRCERTDRGLIWRAPDGERVPLRIKFMGLFDTVASVGGPTLHLDWASELAIPPEVERCVHYVAAHEVRRAFPLDSVRVDRAFLPTAWKSSIPARMRMWAAAYAPDEQGRSDLLSRIPLRHMLAEALRSGVPLQLPQQLELGIREDYTLPDDPSHSEPLPGLHGRLAHGDRQRSRVADSGPSPSALPVAQHGVATIRRHARARAAL